MTSDQGEMFNEYKRQRKEKRAKNRESSYNILRENNIDFDVRNQGAHLIVYSTYVVDFWPGTGKWICRETSTHGRGVGNLLKYLNKRP